MPVIVILGYTCDVQNESCTYNDPDAQKVVNTNDNSQETEQESESSEENDSSEEKMPKSKVYHGRH